MKKAGIVLVVLILLLGCVPAFAAGENTLYNGAFAIMEEGGVLPDGWYFEAWDHVVSDWYTDGVTYPQTMVVLHNFEENDARICQKIAVKPHTAYRFTCELLVQDVQSGAGATLSIMDTLVTSEEYYDTDGWVKAELVGVTQADQTELVLGLRLGGYSRLSAGRTMFRNVTMTELSTIPPDAKQLVIAEVPSQSGGGSETIAPNWPGIALATLLMAILSAAAYLYAVWRRGSKQWPAYPELAILILALAFFLRVLLSIRFVGHSTDIVCFSAWADTMAAHGARGFYATGMFADYPPGYMYVLWGIGELRRLLDISYDSALFTIMLKLPAICADLGSAYLVYHFARKKGMEDAPALFVLGVAAFLPVAAFISGGWGQIDSLLALCLVGVVLLFANDKRILAGVIYGIAILMKPQALMAGPLLAVVYLLPDKALGVPYRKRLLTAVLAVLGAFAVIIGLSAPFGAQLEQGWLIEKYFSTANSYPYASIEGFNMAALFRGNWRHIDEVPLLFTYGAWGVLGILIGVVLAVSLYIKERKRSLQGALLLAMSVLFAALFTLGPYMHERYLFPALLPLLLAAVQYDDKRLFGAFLAFSTSLLFNTLCAFYIVDFPSARGVVYQTFTLVGSLMTVSGFAYFLYACYRLVWQKAEAPTALYLPCTEAGTEGTRLQVDNLAALRANMPYDRKLHYTQKDRILCCAITAIYACFALTNLGSRLAPETEYYSDTRDEAVAITFDQPVEIASVWVFGGIATGDFTIEDEQGNFLSHQQEYDQMFRWTKLEAEFEETSALRFYQSDGLELRVRELALFSHDGERIAPTSVSANGTALFDEANTVPDHPSYYNGMYFDELYHARTAYEHLNGLDPYENSHPPLGKVLIMLGIAVFGMNAFGWRIVGALVGIAMLPVLYAFGKRIFKKTEFALFVTVLFAFDFMHFTQTRIATIDVYAVFFILLMYYYMYQYFCMNFFVDGLRATLRPLALAGLFFGIGAASKWTCIYAGGGLAVILFLSLFQRFRECRAAMHAEDPVLQERVRPFLRYTIYTLLWCCLFYIVVPVAIYLAAYLPYVLCEKQYGLRDIWSYQKFMFSYHSQLTASHPYESPWWQWPFTVRPMWYYWGGGNVSSDTISTLSASGSPAVWWLCSLATFYYVGKSLLRTALGLPAKSNATPVVLVGLAANYLPWVLVTRCTFIYHFFTTVPFIVLCGGLFLFQQEEENSNWKWIRWAWMCCVVLLFLLLYPGISGLEVPLAYAEFLSKLPGGMLFYGV